MPPHAAVFDLDGTLVDSLGDIAAAMNHALAQHGLPTHPVPAYRRFVGEGVVQLVRKALSPAHAELHETVLSSYRACYAECLLDTTRPFAGIPELLEELAARGVRLAVLSNKPHASTQRIVSALLPGVPFVAVYGERSGVPRKPDPTAALGLAGELGVPAPACAFIGDTPVDMNTARAAGMYGVGVTWGFRDAEELRADGAQAVVSSVEELRLALRAPLPAPQIR